jgi:hypothetical protein
MKHEELLIIRERKSTIATVVPALSRASFDSGDFLGTLGDIGGFKGPFSPPNINLNFNL